MYKRILFAFVLFLSLSGAPLYAADNTSEMLEDALGKITATLEKIPERINKVSIYSITPDKSGKINIENLQDQLITILVETGRFAVIDRSSLKALMDEQRLSMTGAINTQDIVKAGKVIGVQGFFFGSVAISEGVLTLNLKLVDVESSAIIYSKKFEGEAASGSRFGFGFSFMSGSFSSKLDNHRIGSVDPIQESNSDMPAATTGGIGFALSYKQGSKMLKWANFGVDLFFGGRSVGEMNVAESNINLDGGGTGTGSYGINYSLSVMQLSIVPKLYYTNKRKVFHPYIGLGINLVFLQEEFGGWYQDGATYQPHESKSRAADLITITPVIGAEMNLSKSISVFFEGALNSKKNAGSNPEIYFADMNIDSHPAIESGTHITAGLKYYWNFF